MNVLSFQNLRGLFVIGNVIYLVLLFVPSYGLDAIGGQKLMSDLEMMRRFSQTGNLFEFIFLLIVAVVAPLAWIVLALVYPKRWVFIAGASLVVFNVLLELFSGGSPDVKKLLIPRILAYVADAFVMTGFVAKPSKSITR